mmetsp:Transcript_6158/g.12317  ORF Transcript_6158/g.12317 Transcript_6158/m.12317 type:complete len:84 (-) Transcript_6158:4-255(-)
MLQCPALGVKPSSLLHHHFGPYAEKHCEVVGLGIARAELPGEEVGVSQNICSVTHGHSPKLYPWMPEVMTTTTMMMMMNMILY